MQHSRRRGLLVVAIALIVLGGCGLVVSGAMTALLGGTTTNRSSSGGRTGGTGAFGGYASNGERIFFTGVGHDGPIDVEWSGGMMGPGRGRMAGLGCATCHGRNGRGRASGMMGVAPPDIRYKTLTGGGSDEETGERWTDADIAAAVRSGTEPGGGTLSTAMPRWKMDDTDMADVIDYLKELD